MIAAQNEIVSGFKIFFVVPELSLLPEAYLKSFFMKGFETYFLDDDPYISLETKIHTLFALFPEVILFFNIDRPVRGIDWPLFIATIQDTYKERARIGVLYRKRNSAEEIKMLEWQYLYEIGIVCGCIPIEYQKSKNLFLLINVLIANQANGQRKFLRAVCDDSCKMNFMHDGNRYHGVLQDISISHFSCIFIGEPPDLFLAEKVTEIQIRLKGSILLLNAVCCLKRVIKKCNVHVFVFRHSDDREGLTADQLLKVNDYVFMSFFNNIKHLLKIEFENTVHSGPGELSRLDSPRSR